MDLGLSLLVYKINHPAIMSIKADYSIENNVVCIKDKRESAWQKEMASSTKRTGARQALLFFFMLCTSLLLQNRFWRSTLNSKEVEQTKRTFEGEKTRTTAMACQTKKYKRKRRGECEKDAQHTKKIEIDWNDDTNLTNLSTGGISSVCPVHGPSLEPSRGRGEPSLGTRLRKYQYIIDRKTTFNLHSIFLRPPVHNTQLVRLYQDGTKETRKLDNINLKFPHYSKYQTNSIYLGQYGPFFPSGVFMSPTRSPAVLSCEATQGIASLEGSKELTGWIVISGDRSGRFETIVLPKDNDNINKSLCLAKDGCRSCIFGFCRLVRRFLDGGLYLFPLLINELVSLLHFGIDCFAGCLDSGVHSLLCLAKFLIQGIYRRVLGVHCSTHSSSLQFRLGRPDHVTRLLSLILQHLACLLFLLVGNFFDFMFLLFHQGLCLGAQVLQS
ncbi:hypothetical protein C0J52_03978 [Blattella germanica]|nr:hypothetical protein C0J52_03978 [Blattella germanica]